MLTLIRHMAKNPLIGGIIIALLVAAFALWGVTDVIRGGGTSAIIVGTERVSAQDLQRTFNRQLRQMQMDNPRLTREEADAAGFGDQIVQQMTLQAALAAKAGELGLSISDQAVFESIRTIPAFQNPFTGRFDQATFVEVLQQSGYTGASIDRQFERDMARGLRQGQFVDAIIDAVDAPLLFVQNRQAWRNERRALRALLIPPRLAGDVGDPDDEMLEAFIESNAGVFERPEQRRFTLIRFAPELFERDVQVSEEDIEDLYAFRLSQGDLAEPAVRSYEQWAAPDQDSAEAAARMLTEGQAVASVREAHGLAERVNFTDLQQSQVPDRAIAAAVFEMDAGDIRAVDSRLGWRVVRVTQAVDPAPPSLDDMREELRSQLAVDLAEEAQFEAMGAFEDARRSGLDLDEAAEAAGVPVERFDYLTANAFTVDGAPAASLLEEGGDAIMQLIFSLTPGLDSELEIYGEGKYLVARVDSIETARLPSVDEVREDAEAFWRLRTVDERLQVIVDDAMERIQAGDSLEAVAAVIGDGVSVEIATLGREESAGPFNRNLVSQAFNAPRAAPFPARAGDQRTRAIVIVDEIIAPRPATPGAELRQSMQEELENDLAMVLQNALLEAYTVRTDPRLIDQALGRIDPNL
ncbi:MAG: SurA N-terminal domain-containing protein [Oceanicaulis sp.]|nr:SurA N-terminal domain-containing protein [Oceanicaulis sp.]